MKNKIALSIIGLCGATLIHPVGMKAASDVSVADAPHPNIVVILADDHSLDAVSCYGSKLIQTPNIDRIADEGMRFTRAYANNSICSPSRAVLLTGKYNNICGVEKLDGHFDGAQETFPKLLQKAGYETAIIGKWHLYTEPTGFDYYSCITPGWGGGYYNPKLKEIGQPWINGQTGGKVHKGYLTDIITDLSLHWLNHRDSTKPFCLLMTYHAPHAPHDVAPRYKNLLKDTVLPDPPTLLDDYQGRAPALVANQLAWSRLVQIPDKQYQPVKKQFNGDRSHDTRLMYEHYARDYLRMVAALDENVGRVLDYIEISGLATNTIVIYASDNGFFLGEHGFYNKMWMYETGFHIPLIIHLPGEHTATTNDQIVSMVDVAPTILALAGLKVPADIQGCSMKPLLLDEPCHWRDALYYHYYGYGASTRNNWIASPRGGIFGVRTRTAELVCYPQWKGGPFWEMFNLQKDPHDMHNLYHDPASQPEIHRLKEKLRALAEKYQDTNTVKMLDKLVNDGKD